MMGQSRPAKELHTLDVNGENRLVAFEDSKTLLELLREELELTGTKHGCEMGECGACTVLVDGEAIVSCLYLGIEAVGHEVTTIEGLMNQTVPDPLQIAFAEKGGSQCGYCTPGMILTARALLNRTAHPSRDEIKAALAGNLCRCTGYTKIIEAVEAASELSPESAIIATAV
jgi:aerobic-type carbon monoxide dehydrogenase small subunit (CoxS/CutS family)